MIQRFSNYLSLFFLPSRSSCSVYSVVKLFTVITRGINRRTLFASLRFPRGMLAQDLTKEYTEQEEQNGKEVQ